VFVLEEWHLNLLNEVYSFCYLCISLRISDEVFDHITAESALEPALALCFGCKFIKIKCGSCFLECPRVLKVCLSDSVSVQLVISASLVFTVSPFSAGSYVLSCQICMWCFFSMPSFPSDSYCTMTVTQMSEKSISKEGKNCMCFPDGCPCLAGGLGCSRHTGRQMCVAPRYAKVAVICSCALKVPECSFLGRLKDR